MSTSDDQCVIENQPPATLPPSYPINNITDNHGVVVTLFLLAAIIAIVLVIGVVALGYRSNRYSPPEHPRPTAISVVPFVVLQDSVASQQESHRKSKSYHDLLRQVVESYRREGSQALSGLSAMLDEALASEAALDFNSSTCCSSGHNKWLSGKIHGRIQKTAECLEHDEKVLAQLLGNFTYVLALPDKDSSSNRESNNNNNNNNNNNSVPFNRQSRSTKFRMPNNARNNLNNASTHSYDSATQIFAHLVRDWTTEGKPIRHALYDWCANQMNIYCQTNSTVLVPGSGMGRLAYDLSTLGYSVEANELSPSMAAAAKSVLALSGRNGGSFRFHPYLLDGMANEVDSTRRFASVECPDVKLKFRAATKGSLSYTVGDFSGSEYYRKDRANSFDAIVTCFFIDTATNIYDYLRVIRNLLTTNGVWINVGPVQWHHNALLRPSVDELKDILEACGWKLKVWSIDAQPISYRDQNGDDERSKLPPMTSYDGYRPLRFVAIKNQ